MKYFVGILKGHKRELFRYHKTPEHSDNLPYLAVIGPFRTKRGAKFMVECGASNPHCQTVSDAERIALSIYADQVAKRFLGLD